MRRLVWMVVGVLVAIVGWHVVQSFPIRADAESFGKKRLPANATAEASVNPFTDLVTVNVMTPLQREKSDPLAGLGAALESALGETVSAVFEPSVERDLNIRARERYDLYAIVVPYRVRIKVGKGDSE